MRIGTSQSIGLIGLSPFLVTIQTFLSPGLPSISLIGLPDASLAESKERVKSAITALGVRWPQTRIVVNLSPASLPKHGSAHDCAIAISLLGAIGVVDPMKNKDVLVVGELNLDGTLLPISGLLPILLYAKRKGLHTAIVPEANADEARLIDGISVHTARSLAKVVQLLGGTLPRQASSPQSTSAPLPVSFSHSSASSAPPSSSHPAQSSAAASCAHLAHSCERAASLDADSLSDSLLGTNADEYVDMADVIGQHSAKRALEICAAGHHHALLYGPPGTGKSMLAHRLTSIMPPLDEREKLEVASIRSVCGTLARYGVTSVPPFEAPHHTVSVAAMAGGGTGIAHPGAVTKAHDGVLFLDEAPEFSARALQVLREPLETSEIILSRSQATAVYPAHFLLLMAANPCPCGKGWGNARDCTCTSQQRKRYFGRLSGPLLDRIDMQIEVPPVHLSMNSREESSASIRARVIQARGAYRELFGTSDTATRPHQRVKWLRARTSRACLALLSSAVDRGTLSLRGADRSLRVAWTIALLDGRMSPNPENVAEAMSLRPRHNVV
ncbi:YifB family Mg chelatase-like AAA ATPase [Aeriscardovia aeriphila]|uniref:ATPase AAA n=1 Tax=Aeriscardovia aeriphila TaxID=218139 RepID=A0A261F9P2_9BIFI|nr:YifB family Mg chelatase-like AAA ATPase [Aeriscardovia aeriphila]NYI25973.1 magnesium chelatase family protein [Aeriscardovia aeriphila]OZG55879.1 ATPase AAA [Aeriscardovia aeriphila]